MSSIEIKSRIYDSNIFFSLHPLISLAHVRTKKIVEVNGITTLKSKDESKRVFFENRDTFHSFFPYDEL